MKVFLTALILVLFTANTASAQKILLKIASITPAAGEEVKAADFKVDLSISLAAGGSGIGKSYVRDFLIKKLNGPSTNELYKKSLGGLAIPAVVIEYYDASNVLYFTITLKTVYVTNFYWLSPECPTCLKLEHQIAFTAKQYETFDVSTGVTIKYDVSTNSFY